MTAAEPLARRLGAMLKCAPLEDPFEYRFMFDLTANTFLQKLVPKRVMDRKLFLAPGTQLRALLVLSYATTVFDQGERLLENLAVLEREHARLAREAGRKGGLPLGLVVTEVALHAAEHETAADEPACRARFARLDASRCACDPARLDPYYEAMGYMLADQLTLQDGAARVASKGEYLAAAFCDAFLPQLADDADRVARRMLAGEVEQAAREALLACAGRVTLADLEEFFGA